MILHPVSPLQIPLQLRLLILHATCSGQENKEGIVAADQTSGRRHAATSQQYDLQSKAAAVVASHDAWTETFASYAVQMDDCRMTGRPAAPQV